MSIKLNCSQLTVKTGKNNSIDVYMTGVDNTLFEIALSNFLKDVCYDLNIPTEYEEKLLNRIDKIKEIVEEI